MVSEELPRNRNGNGNRKDESEREREKGWGAHLPMETPLNGPSPDGHQTGTGPIVPSSSIAN